jgi:glycogen operon protein
LSSTRATRTRRPRRRSIVDLLPTFERGRPQPLGATVDDTGVNFSIFSEEATGVELLLFDAHDDLHPVTTIQFDPIVNRSFHFWHMYVRGLAAGYHYAYRVTGPNGAGHRFDSEKVLLDPYAKGNTNTLWKPVDACLPGDNLASSMRAVIVDGRGYDWEGDEPLRRPMSDTIVYELNVRGFTVSPTSGVAHPGTFSGLIEKIPYLQELGVTAVELLPVFAFDEREVRGINPLDGSELRNYWGYDPYLHFSPQASYCVNPDEGSQISEFRDVVKALHKAGIEVILDVVFNHTAEGNHLGPTISFKGLGNNAYYLLHPTEPQYYMDYSGCGNTVNANHPIVEKFIVDCLHFWVEEMHVDGFRFDEGSVLARGGDGAPMQFPPVVWGIELSDKLADTKVIAEAWDAGGLYHVGRFPGARWSDWNGRFRDDVRRFVRGDLGLVPTIASRLSGSMDMYEGGGRGPSNSINFVTAHDGFTMYDLVSYNSKHNEANGEGNRDGVDENLSWNCGVEGETDDAAVNALRHRQVKNFAAVLFLSQGVPMFVAGDEVGRTQHGNNNAYCQDNDLSWFDWTLLERNADLFRFFKRMIGLRRRHTSLRRRAFLTGGLNRRGLQDVRWHGLELDQPEWHDPGSRVLAFTIAGDEPLEPDLHVMMNMDDADHDFAVPVDGDRRWILFADTAKASPEDIAEPGEAWPFEGERCTVEGRSIVILESQDS